MNYKFKIEIRKSKDKQFYAVLVAKNGEDVFTGETRTRRSGIVKTINNLFPGVEIINK